MAKLLLLISLAGTLSSVFAFDYGKTQIRGVNLGGWLVLEKWITPSVFSEVSDDVKDEYTLSKTLGYAAAEKRLKDHRDSWVTEADIIALKNAGINHLRIPFGYWAFEIPAGEPWVKGSWDYVMKAVGWAKKQGMQVVPCLHGAPGSQNGNDHSGRIGNISFFSSDDNLNRATAIVGKVAKTFNTAEWKSTVTVVEVLNEPILWDDYTNRLNKLKQYYRQAYDEVRKNSADVVVAVHDAFIDATNWYYLGEDAHYKNVMLDTHLYQVFNSKWTNWTCDQHYAQPCNYIAPLQDANKKLWTVVGEWSLATPKNCQNQGTFARQQIGAYEKASGWIMWNFKNGQGWNEWDFLASNKLGWINLKTTNTAKC